MDVPPAEAPLIRADGRNKWKTIIQNAGLGAASGWFFSDYRVAKITQTRIEILMNAGGGIL